MNILTAISNFFSRVMAAITWNSIVNALKFMNVTDKQTGYLSPPKVLVWFLSIGICFIMFQIGDDDMDLAVFAGAIATLVGAFGVAYKLGMDSDKDEQDERDERERDRRHRDRNEDYQPPERPYGTEEDIRP